MEKTFAVQNDFSDTVRRYVEREMGKGKDPRKTMARLMVAWLLNALSHTPREDGNEIYMYLTGLTRLSEPKTRRKRAKVVDEFRNTLAAAIINHRDYKGARAMRKAGNVSGYYQLARKYANARKFSAGLHQAGFMTGVRFLRRMTSVRVGQMEKTPKYKHEPGGIESYYSPNQLRLEASNFAKIIAEIAPNAFEQGAAKTAMFFNQFLQDDQLAEMKTAGLNAKRA